MKKAIVITGLLLALIGIIFGWGYLNQSKFKTVQADVGNVIEVVSETGELVSQKDFNLKFKVSGNLKTVQVDVGDSVKEGQVLAELNDKELTIELSEAQAALRATQASLRKIREGARQEDIQVYKTAAENADTTLKNAKKELIDIKKSTAEEISLAQSTLETTRVDLENVETIANDDLSDVYQNASIALNDSLIATDQALDSIKDILDLDRKDKILKVKDSRLLNETQIKEGQIIRLYVSSKDFFDSIQNEPTNSELDDALGSAMKLLDGVHELLGMTETLLDKTIVSSRIPQTELDRLIGIIDAHNDHISLKKSEITSMQQNIQVIKLANQSKLDKASNAVTLAEQKLSSVRALSSAKINAAESAVRSAQGALKSAQDNLALKKANPRGSDINFYQAQVNQAESRIDLINEQLTNLELLAPADGVITAKKAEAGEFVGAGQTVIAMIAEKAWQIEVYIEEEDILKVKIGDTAKVSLDAYGKERIFNGEVFSSEPQRTVIDDSVYYKTVVILDEDDESFRNGMTADIDIVTSEKTNVLRIDKRALKEQNGKFIVRVKKGWQIDDREVAVGLIGTDYAEIISGLTEGEDVVIAKK